MRHRRRFGALAQRSEEQQRQAIGEAHTVGGGHQPSRVGAEPAATAGLVDGRGDAGAGRIVEVGKVPFGRSWKQDDINALMVTEALAGNTVVRLKGGDPAVFGRLDEEVAALEAAGVRYGIVPGITSASASAAAIGQSLTRRGRNSAFRILTGHDVAGFAEHDWRELARPGSTAAIYMGVKAAAFLRGRLLMHGAAADTPVSAVENASRPEQRVIATTLIDLPKALAEATPQGPVMILYGLAPRAAASAVSQLKEAL